MATNRQRAVANRNIRKAQAAWQTMTPRQRALAQPKGQKRQKPGTVGGGVCKAAGNRYRQIPHLSVP